MKGAKSLAARVSGAYRRAQVSLPLSESNFNTFKGVFDCHVGGSLGSSAFTYASAIPFQLLWSDAVRRFFRRPAPPLNLGRARRGRRSRSSGKIDHHDGMTVPRLASQMRDASQSA
jgi:hypothetical protein